MIDIESLKTTLKPFLRLYIESQVFLSWRTVESRWNLFFRRVPGADDEELRVYEEVFAGCVFWGGVFEGSGTCSQIAWVTLPNRVEATISLSLGVSPLPEDQVVDLPPGIVPPASGPNPNI